MNLARTIFSTMLLLTFSVARAQQIPKYKPNAKITYDRFQDVTWYEMQSIKVQGWANEEGSMFHSPPISINAMFACKGNTDEKPCTPTAIMFAFGYEMIYQYHVLPFTYQSSDVIAISDGQRIPFGRMNVTSGRSVLGDFEAKGTLPVSLQTLRRLATANSIEMRIGVAPVVLETKDIESLGSFYNMAVLTARQRIPPTRRRKRP